MGGGSGAVPAGAASVPGRRAYVPSPLDAALILGAIALIAMPTLIGIALVFWDEDGGSHSPIIIAGVAYVIWLRRDAFARGASRRAIVAGAAVFALGCLVYALGRLQSFYQVQAASWLLLGAGAALATGGQAALRRIAVPLLILLLAIPLPGSIVDDLLVPIKLALSEFIVSAMAWWGFPVASNGVFISVGYVELMVADACAGLRSLVSLTAICLLGNLLVPPRTRIASVAVALLVVPIAILTNMLRIAILILIAYYRGAGAVKTAHDYAAYIEVALSIGLLTTAHIVLDRLFAPRRPRRAIA